MIMKIRMILLTSIIMALVNYGPAMSHENEDFKHGSISCHGWFIMDSGMRKCFLDNEGELCSTIIYNHGNFHVSEPHDCQPKGKEDETENKENTE